MPGASVRGRGWILYVASRFLKTKRKNGNAAPSLFSVLGLAAGVLTLISVMAVMNGFQLGFIEDILEISSYHVRVFPPEESGPAALMEMLGDMEQVESVVPFIDVQTMLEGPFSGTKGSNVRGIAFDAPVRDRRWAEQLNIGTAYAEGGREFIEEGTVWVGSVLAESLGITVGDTVSFISMAGDSFRGLRPAKEEFTVSLIFSSGYYEYDAALSFVRLDEIGTISSGREQLHLGVKLKERWNDRQFMRALRRTSVFPGDTVVTSWREYNRSFFGALRMEKLAMMLIIGIVFLVVGVNIKHSLERSVWEQREAIGLLRSVGARPSDIRTVFLIDGAIIGTAGSGIGTAFGLLIAENINELFRLTERLVNGGIALLGTLTRPFFAMEEGTFSLFSPAYFYLQEIPSRVMYREVLMVCVFTMTASLLAAWGASKDISDFDPAEILRYE